jgi:hypothetical protein
MALDDYVKDLSLHTRGLLLLTAFALILPPFWFLFEFAKEQVFDKYSYAILITLSVAINFPVVMINYGVLSSIIGGSDEEKSQEGAVIAQIFVAALITVPIYFMPEILTWFTHVSLFIAKLITSISEAVLLIFLVFVILVERNKKSGQ